MCPAKEPGKEEMGFFPGPDTYQRWHFCLQSLCASVITLKSTKGSIDKHTFPSPTSTTPLLNSLLATGLASDKPTGNAVLWECTVHGSFQAHQ